MAFAEDWAGHPSGAAGVGNTPTTSVRTSQGRGAVRVRSGPLKTSVELSRHRPRVRGFSAGRTLPDDSSASAERRVDLHRTDVGY